MSDSTVDLEAGTSPTPEESTTSWWGRLSRGRRIGVGVVAVGLIAAVVYVFAFGQSANIPPAGTIWFGKSFNQQSFEVQDRLSSVGAEDEFVMVGQLTGSVPGSRLVIRAYLDDKLVTIAWTDSTDQRGIWGFDMGPVHHAGTWRYEIADSGGKAKASGEIQASQ